MAFYINSPTIAKGEKNMDNFKINLQLFGGNEEEDYILPDDYQEEETVVETAEPQAEIEEQQTDVSVEDTKPTETQQEQTPVEVPKVKLKYNHEERELTLDEVVPLAQKGLNYDKIQAKLQELEKNPALAYVEKVAKANNMTVDQLIEAWQRADEQAEIQQLAERENVPYEIAERLYKVEKETNQIKTALQTEQQTKAEQEKQQREFAEFLENYPDVKAESIPKEVWEYRERTGKTLTDAMTWYENQQLKNELKILKQNLENVKKAPVNGVTTYGSNENASKDPFEIGFDSI